MSLTLHEGATFLVSDDRGDVHPSAAFGYYHRDTRFLSERELRLDGELPMVLGSEKPHPHEGVVVLTNPALHGVPRASLELTLRRMIGGGFHEELEIESFSGERAVFDVSFRFGADFAFILTVKSQSEGGADAWKPDVQVEPSHDRRTLTFHLEASELLHETRIHFSQPFSSYVACAVHFGVELEPRQRWRLCYDLSAQLGDDTARPRFACQQAAEDERTRWRDERSRELRSSAPSLETDHPVLRQAYEQASADLIALRIRAQDDSRTSSRAQDQYAIAAGIPWYLDLFGRDSLIASIASVHHDPSLARGTIEALARLQGTKLDPISEEAPGKILHEYRRGPVPPAARKMIPSYPYYGTIDATPLFLIALSEYVRWTGDLAFAREHWDHVRAALEWIRRYGDRDGDGLLEYQRDSELGLINQGWKDSTDSVRFRDGKIAQSPIALIEVQGYAFDARRRMAQLARHLGHPAEAAQLEHEAARLHRRLDAFWLAERGFYAEALDRAKRPVDALTSNPGHLLWCCAVRPERARQIAATLMSDEMFSGFGIRTMGSAEGGYNPVSYHNGSVWPHDNALILTGMVQCGLKDNAVRLASGLLRALGCFERAQPPELFCGFASSRFEMPVAYPNANRPQAWASAAVLLLVRDIVGLEIDLLERHASLRPLPLPGVQRLVLRDLPVGDGKIRVEVEYVDGQPRGRIEGLGFDAHT